MCKGILLNKFIFIFISDLSLTIKLFKLILKILKIIEHFILWFIDIFFKNFNNFFIFVRLIIQSICPLFPYYSQLFLISKLNMKKFWF